MSARALETRRFRSQRDLRKIRRPGDADLRVGGNQVLLGFADVRTALQQRGWNSGREPPERAAARSASNPRGMSPGLFPRRMLIAFSSCAICRSKIGDFGRSGVHQLLRLANIQQMSIPCLLLDLRQLQRSCRDARRAFGNLQLKIQLAKLEIVEWQHRRPVSRSPAFCAHSLASRVARADSVARRYLPQKSRFQAADAVNLPLRTSVCWESDRARDL